MTSKPRPVRFVNARLPSIAAIALSLGACGERQPVEQIDACATGKTMASVMTFATFAEKKSDTIAEGIDIDGIVSEPGDTKTCGKPDFTSPDGRKGIDNQFGGLLPLIKGLVGAENLDAILEGAIANGQLLILVAVDGVDDAENDECVSVRLGAGLGTPFLDTAGKYEPYQTFGFNEEDTPVSRLPAGRIENGVLYAGPSDIVLPVRALDAAFNLKINAAKLRMKVTEDPLNGGLAVSGVTAGGIDVEEFKNIVRELNIAGGAVDAITGVVGGVADLAPNADGSCQEVSAGLRIESEPAFLLEQPQ